MRFMWILTIVLAAGFVADDASAQDPAAIVKGAQVWASNCARCHNARSPLERSDREWYTIMQHMRVRANLTRNEALSVSVYLQSSNGIETAPVALARETTPAINSTAARTPKQIEDARAEQLATADSLKKQIDPKQLNRMRKFLQDQQR